MITSLTTKYKKLELVSAITIASFLILSNIGILNYAYSQNDEKISIKLNSALFGPLPGFRNLNTVMVVVDYKTTDLSLIGDAINGIMDVYDQNGNRIKTSSFSNGFETTESGKIRFAASFTDETLKNVRVNVGLTDADKTELISNLVSADIKFDKDTKIPPPSIKDFDYLKDKYN